MKQALKKLGYTLVLLFACIGVVFTGVFIAMKIGITKTPGLIDTQNDFWRERAMFLKKLKRGEKEVIPQPYIGSWVVSDEWTTLKEAVLKDREQIFRAAQDAGVNPRLIVSVIVSEQLRLFTSQRQTFKQVFQPLRVLGTQTQFSLGVTGIKDETIRAVEEHLRDKTSPYYLGTRYESVLDYPTTPTSAMRFARFSNYNDHYYSYLYTGLFLRQVMTQWEQAGYPISDRPEILATIYNLGFLKSIPKPDPLVGGSEITITGETYTFGGLAGEFFISSELAIDFPQNIQ